MDYINQMTVHDSGPIGDEVTTTVIVWQLAGIAWPRSYL